MADDAVFAADPAGIKSGGGIMDQISKLIHDGTGRYADDTAFDPQNPPWGGDTYGKQFAQNYLPVHTQLLAAYVAFGNAVLAAGLLTRAAGDGFATAQEGALGRITGTGRRR
ncbi:hypothetical protein ABT255_52710 [Streptomyces mirabilis]|uniref:hypothetical protein n=1 Tax=Streptomyces mirabilis TaxID=68239 RepID=UPI003329A93E